MLETILKMAASIVFAHYRVIAGFFALLTVAAIYTVFHMEIRTDLIDVLPGDNPAVSQFRDFVQKYNVLESVTVIISTKSNAVEEYVDLIETLSSKMKQSRLIEQVDYTAFGKDNEFFLHNFPLFLGSIGMKQLYERLSPVGIERRIRLNYQTLVSPVGSAADYELIERDPLGLRDIIAASLKSSHPDNPLDLSLGYYLTKDHSTALIFVKPAGRSKDMAFVKKLRPELETLVRSALADSGNPQGVSVQLTGGHIFSDDVRKVIRHDIVSSTLLSVVLITLIIWLAYRVRPIVLGIVACTTLASLSMTLAVAYFIFGSLNIVTSVVVGLLIGMYVDYCILTLKRFGDEMLLKKDRQTALALTMTRAGAAMVMSAITTSLSFFSIIVTGFNGLYELGIVSGIGVLICLVVTLFLMNSLLVWASDKGADSILSLSKPSSGIEWLAPFIGKYPRRVAIAAILFAMVLGFGMKGLEFDNNPEHIGIRNSESVAAMKTLNQKLMNSGEPLEVLIMAKDTDGLTAAYDRLEQLLVQWKIEGLISRADSLSAFLPPPGAQKNAIRAMEGHAVDANSIQSLVIQEMDKNGMAYDRDRLKAYLSSIAGALQRSSVIGLDGLSGIADSRIKRFFNKQDMSMVAYLHSGTGSWTGGTIDTLQKQVAGEGKGWTLLGTPILYSEIKSSIIRGSALAAVITLGLNVLFVVLFLRKGIYTVLAMLPVCLGFLLTLSIMGWLGAPLNFINVGTLALIFGFGVDYGLYIMQSYLREETRDVNNALRLSGKNVMMCAATTIAGCGSLITADFAGIASIGLVLTIGAVCCSAITLILLPSLLWLQERKATRGKI